MTQYDQGCQRGQDTAHPQQSSGPRPWESSQQGSSSYSPPSRQTEQFIEEGGQQGGMAGGYGSQGQHGSQARQDDAFDPDYHQWRSEQMRTLDNDYREWRSDRYKKFSDEFNQWRRSRTGSGQGAQSRSSGSEPGSGTQGPSESDKSR